MNFSMPFLRLRFDHFGLAALGATVKPTWLTPATIPEMTETARNGPSAKANMPMTRVPN